jgi:FkbM family methyltransferase
MSSLDRAINKLRHYHAALGMKGVIMFLYSKATRRHPIANVRVPGIAHPVKLRIGTTDVSTFRQVLVGKQYEFDQPETANFIIDAGANIGLSALFFANRYPEAKIVAIEPEDSNYEMLCLNAKPYPGIKPVRAALWKENEDLFLFDKGHGNHGFQISGSGNDDGSRVGSVPGLTVDSILREAGEEKIDILKVDIEGAEREVFATPAEWIGRVGTVMVELHDEIKPGCNDAFNHATRHFSSAVMNGETIMRRAIAAHG